MKPSLEKSRCLTAMLLAAALMSACGGGGGGDAPPATTPPVTVTPGEPGAPALTGNTATDGYNWINYRRAQIGINALARNGTIDRAAQSHSEYLKANNTVSHNQVAGSSGFTGVTLLDRLRAAGYGFTGSHAYGEVISATGNASGAYAADELITAIYHRFVIFEPRFKEIGTGAASNASGYTYFTADFTANAGYGAGVSGVVVWPFDLQTRVPLNFLSDYESPDPVANLNEVGYPVSVHANIDATVTVDSFTIRPRGGAALAVKLLSNATDSATHRSAAAIVPLTVLRSGTVYDVAFSGKVNGANVTRTWSFTTR
jgi:uncharacterized protein YkwD